MHHGVAGSIPYLVAKVAESFGSSHIEFYVSSSCSQRVIGEAQGISAVGSNTLWKTVAGQALNLLFQLGLHHVSRTLLYQVIKLYAIDQINWVQDIALGFGHFLPMFITNQASDIDFLKRNFPGELQCHHDHPSNPEEDNVEAGY